MKLIDFATQTKAVQSEQEFVDRIGQVIDLAAIQKLSRPERDALFDAVQYLTDYVLLVREAKGEIEFHDGAPYIEYSGPFIPNILTRPDDVPLDTSILKTFGIEAPDEHVAKK